VDRALALAQEREAEIKQLMDESADLQRLQVRGQTCSQGA
jgi:hypothetical protein